MKLFKNRKGFAGAPAATMIGFVVLIITVAIGALVLANVQGTLTSGTAAHNVTVDGLSAFDNYSNLLPVVGIVLIAALIIALVTGSFRARG